MTLFRASTNDEQQLFSKRRRAALRELSSKAPRILCPCLFSPRYVTASSMCTVLFGPPSKSQLEKGHNHYLPILSVETIRVNQASQMSRKMPNHLEGPPFVIVVSGLTAHWAMVFRTSSRRRLS